MLQKKILNIIQCLLIIIIQILHDFIKFFKFLLMSTDNEYPHLTGFYKVFNFPYYG